MSALERSYNKSIRNKAKSVGWNEDGSPIDWMVNEIKHLREQLKNRSDYLVYEAAFPEGRRPSRFDGPDGDHT